MKKGRGGDKNKVYLDSDLQSNDKLDKLIFFEKIKKYFKEHKKTGYFLIILIGIILILLTVFVSYKIFYKSPIKTNEKVVFEKEKPKEKLKEEVKFYSALTGEIVNSEADTKKPITAIMIENSPQARPQSGLKDAEVVYEAIAEGGITRFAALYQQNKPQLIGPVRSLRPYFTNWINPWDASIAHVGGSLKALNEVRNGTFKDLDQFFHDGAYWRSRDRYAPHNVYTKFENIDSLNQTLKYNSSNPKTFSREDIKPTPTPNATKIDIKMSGPLFNSSWNYDQNSNTYKRNQADKPHDDRESGQIESSVIVALKVNMEHVMEDGWREEYTTTGSGQAVIFQGGTAAEVTWIKNNPSDQFEFKRSDGSIFKLARGKVWLSAIPTNQGGSVNWSN